MPNQTILISVQERELPVHSPIFVLSTGRCGTLALQRFFNQSEGIEAFHRYRGRRAEYRNDMSILLEQNYAHYRVLSDPSPDSSIRDTVIRRLRKARQPLVERLEAQDKQFLELNHEFSSFGPLLTEAYDSPRFVHLVRDPARVTASFMRKFSPPPMSMPAYFGTRYSLKGQYVLRYGHVQNIARWAPAPLRNWVKNTRYDKHLHPFRRVDGQWKERDDLSSFEKTCWYWNRMNELIQETVSSLPGSHWIRIRSEELFDRNESTLQNLIQFINPPDLDVNSLRRFLGERYNPKSVKTDFPAPKDWGGQRSRTLEQFCGETAEQLGYDRGYGSS